MKLFDTFKKSPLVLLVALVQSLAMAYAASRISEIAKTRRGLAWAAFGILFSLSPLAVAPAEYLLIADKFPGWVCVILALVWSILPDAAIIAAGGVAGKSLVVAPELQQVAQQNEQVASQRRKPRRKVVHNAIDRVQLAQELQRNPTATNTQLAQLFGVTRQAVSKARREIPGK